ncbi:hypothetical protein Psta_2999 [Pirellula staleyi DSM 6068]|uniref:Uncharacterized protein n=1 Tax=Pirellula staleyi (strain ATCC 27377 / DSM 6068 / ICPB 4128) TaxID=530564 RepID=D2R9B4_PIRSD|nr:hypothetical protein [Pirellula staleyi]ADB17664.1 hypothetical protein Psta_2999 [Pirellula staleyi DSM 6068]
MIHYSCDRCKCVISADDLRYQVKMEIEAAMEPIEDHLLDADRDHLLEIDEILEEEALGGVSEEIYQKKRFDLCSKCFRKFMQNPLGRDVKSSLGFSSN